METAPLKSFATWARTSLIKEVTARLAAVLAPGSPERVERPGVVSALEKAIAAAGGEAGKAAIADRVAYTWFNRIIALRFMDANAYTGIGVVSPGADAGGQPEILSAAKGGQIDAAVVTSAQTRDTVLGLLGGTRKSADAQGEAYSILLAEYCRHWNKVMPFMFEREGDYTELLIPSNLLADASVLSRAVSVLTKEVCQDVEVIGWLYQFYISERKQEVFDGFRKNKKAGADEIPAATQLFTPHWIVRYLVENSLGRLWMLNHPASGLVTQMEYYIAPVDEETDFLKITKPEELKVIDPACGSGHMLTYAFDLLYAIYEEEGYTPSEIPGLILTNNLYGTEIDARAGALAAFALTMKARSRQKTFFSKRVEPNICVIDPISFGPEELDFLVTRGGDRDREVAHWNQFARADIFGALVQPSEDLIVSLSAHLAMHPPAAGDLIAADIHDRACQVLRYAQFLSPRYQVVVANPPYMDARNMAPTLYEYLSDKFRAGHTGVDLAFVLRAQSLVPRGGYLGLLSMDSWLGNVECADFRDIVRADLPPQLVLHLGARAFPEIDGEVVQVTATLFQRGANSSSKTTFIGATEGTTVNAKVAQFHDPERRFRHALDWFDVFPGRVLTPYAASEKAHATFGTAPAMNTIAEVRTGLQTGDNVRFLRHWYEVSFEKVRTGTASPGARWVPYVKSSSPTRWFAREDLVVDWANEGAAVRSHQSSVVRNSSYYFRSGLSYGGLAGSLKARLVAADAIFDQKNSMVFPIGRTTTHQLLALMNSSAFETLARLVSPKGFGVGTLAQLPIPAEALVAPRVEELAERAVELTALLFDRSETSRGFEGLSSIFLGQGTKSGLQFAVELTAKTETEVRTELHNLDLENHAFFAEALPATRASEDGHNPTRADAVASSVVVKDLLSYAVGCMFGRYSLDEPGLILADQGSALQDYLAKIPTPTFKPDADNVIPIVEGDWFADDIVARFRQFLRTAFGEEHFEENLHFVTTSLGVKDIRDYFVKSFYKDHWQRYKKRPIYWLFSSPSGAFSAMIYMHRYTPSTVSTVLNEYLREYRAKLEASRQHQEKLAVSGTGRQQATALKEVDRMRKILLELDDYEHKVLYPLATQQVAIDLDDGVRANYPKLGAALRKIPGLEANDD
ncbi:BREX-1 system adenine-specific DNA-methyltransferase PglX [Arthrobacter sp. Rue61a]|uniref:BREX-1 system adenine-specific DNA-methyltransferase PglX n=1 Tax=Arthrobacter sp. Rue61a TaxID=1118963 RepID=UPI000150AE88|nr:BREX-1 system adenine-specific DNA-methyltransferase PglX [Arthrobacter sp. Rue61a]AFR34583.1 putative type II restriction enzyme, methylase subunit [Arthrobacter sp. Rue61a]